MQEITSSTQLDTFVQSQPENVLTVVNISSNATPCVRVFPAVLALAKNFVGYAAFGRLLYETSDETQALANQLKVREVGTTLWALAYKLCHASITVSRIALQLPARWLHRSKVLCACDQCHACCFVHSHCVSHMSRPRPCHLSLLYIP